MIATGFQWFAIPTARHAFTMHEYVQRRQLTEGANLLVFSEKPIIEIAILAGYEAQQAFTSIFTAMYKQSPSQYRYNEKFYTLQLRFRLEACFILPAQEPIVPFPHRKSGQTDSTAEGKAKLDTDGLY